MPFGYVDKYLFGHTRPNWSLEELVKVLSLLLNRYIAIHFLFLFPHADRGFIFGGDALNPVPLFMCISIFIFSSVFCRHLSMFTVSTKLHEVTGSTGVTFFLNGNNKAEIAFILIFMSKDCWKTSWGQDCDFFIFPGVKVLLLFPTAGPNMLADKKPFLGEICETAYI